MAETFLGWQLAVGVAAGATFMLTTLRTFATRPHVASEERIAETGAKTDHVGIESFEEPLLVVGADSRVTAANVAARTLLGFEIVGRDIRLALRQPHALDAIRDAQAGTRLERDIGNLGREDRFYRMRATPTDDGRLLLAFTDISRIRMAERTRADFVANASHELRTPLATIRGFVETLQGPAAEDAPARARFLDIMGREAARMTRLIDDLLSLSRIELDKFVRPQGPLDLEPLLTDVARTLAMRLEADERALIVEKNGLAPVVGDRDQVLQVLHNLLSNAIKYGRSGTPIRLSAVAIEGPAIRIAVEDQGDGIAPSDLPRLTERFYRVDNRRSRQMGGTGLGLAIVKHIVERHRGKLTIDSVVDQGTTVAFTLPLAGEIGTRALAEIAD